MGIEEPMKYFEAVKDKNWRMAMKQEIASIERNNIWKFIKLPPGQKIYWLKVDLQA